MHYYMLDPKETVPATQVYLKFLDRVSYTSRKCPCGAKGKMHRLMLALRKPTRYSEDNQKPTQRSLSLFHCQSCGSFFTLWRRGTGQPWIVKGTALVRRDC